MVVSPDLLPTLKKVRAGIVLVGAVYALYLVFVLFSGKAGGVCALCLSSHVLTLVMAALVVYDATSAR